MIKGTSMDIEQKLRGIVTGAIPFVMARRKISGGFGATPRLPATIEDTYHALHILNLARRYDTACESEISPSPESNLNSFLDARSKFLPTGTRTAYQLLWCCRAAGLELETGGIVATVIARLQATTSLEDWYYGARIMKEIQAEHPLLIAGEKNLALVLDRPWRCVDEAWMLMYLSREFRGTLPRPAPELIGWFRACQSGDGGFGFFPGTTSFAENCYACLRALALLQAAPLHPDRAFYFLNGCQTISGGFGRSSRAAPFLDSTWYTLAALAIIDRQRW
jgi:hypothetical protein